MGEDRSFPVEFAAKPSPEVAFGTRPPPIEDDKTRLTCIVLSLQPFSCHSSGWQKEVPMRLLIALVLLGGFVTAQEATKAASQPALSPAASHVSTLEITIPAGTRIPVTI